MKIKTDKKLDVGYISLKKGKIVSTIQLRPGILADLDKDGEVLGLEILSLKNLAPNLPNKRIKTNRKAA